MSPRMACRCALLFSLLTFGSASRGQDSARVVILSARVGPVIDAVERIYFRVFPPYADFDHAVILRASDGRYFARITRLATLSGVESDTLVEYPETTLLSMAEKIDHLEELKSGEYVMGTEPAELRLAEGERVPLRVEPAAQRKAVASSSPARVRSAPVNRVLPIASEAAASAPELFPLFGIGVGVASYSPDLNGLERIFSEIEEYFKNEGHPVGPVSRSFVVGPVFTACVDARVSSPLTVTLEAGLSAGEVQVRCFSVSCNYAFISGPSEVLRPYIAAGVSRYRFRLERSYGQYVSQYTTLDAVVVEGAKTGGTVRLGMEYLPSRVAHLHLFAAYLLFPTLDATTSLGGSTSLKLSSFQAGFRVVLYF